MSSYNLKPACRLASFSLRRSGRGRLKTYNCYGFSLVQLLAAIGVIALIAAIGVPVLTKYQPNIKLDAGTKQLISDLRYAQQMTISEQKVYYLAMDIINRKYSIIKQENPASPIKTVELDPGINFAQIIGLTDNKVSFNSYGAVSESGQIILDNSQGDTITINVKPSGYIQMQK